MARLAIAVGEPRLRAPRDVRHPRPCPGAWPGRPILTGRRPPRATPLMCDLANLSWTAPSHPTARSSAPWARLRRTTGTVMSTGVRRTLPRHTAPLEDRTARTAPRPRTVTEAPITTSTLRTHTRRTRRAVVLVLPGNPSSATIRHGATRALRIRLTILNRAQASRRTFEMSIFLNNMEFGIPTRFSSFVWYLIPP